MTATVLATRIRDAKRLSQIKFSSVSSSTWAWPWCTHGRSIISSLASVSFTHLSITSLTAWTLSVSLCHCQIRGTSIIALSLGSKRSHSNCQQAAWVISTPNPETPRSYRQQPKTCKDSININNQILAVPKNPPSRSHLAALRRWTLIFAVHAPFTIREKLCRRRFNLQAALSDSQRPQRRTRRRTTFEQIKFPFDRDRFRFQTAFRFGYDKMRCNLSWNRG